MKDMQKLLCWRCGQLPPPSATPSKARGLGLGILGLCFYFCLNFLTNTLKVIHDFLVGETNHFNAETLEKSSTFSVFYQTFWGVVVQTINFNNQFSRGTIKIGYKIPNRALPQPPFRSQPQTLIPQLFLGFSHTRPQFLRSRSQFFVVPKPLHPNTLNPFLHQTSSFSRGSPKRELPVRCCLVSKKAGGVPRSSLP
ncbi:MAG: hypothetical protein RLZZ156_762 [Deinococcota bacterium]